MKALLLGLCIVCPILFVIVLLGPWVIIGLGWGLAVLMVAWGVGDIVLQELRPNRP